jgi:hypothetical protein
MLGKLIAIILAAGLTAATLLTLRQERIALAHEMSTLHREVVQQERTLWKLHNEVAHRCRPEEIRRLMRQLDVEWRTIPDPGAVEEPLDLRDPPTIDWTTIAGSGPELKQDEKLGG